MKLFYRVLAHLLTGIFVILLGWAIVFYWGIMEEINDEVDDSLEDYSELVIIRSLAGKELPAHDNGSNNQYFLKEVDASYALSKEAICYRDSMIYIAEKGETEPARILTTIFKDKDERYYELSVYTPTIEKRDLKEAIFQLLIGLFVVLLITILVINVWVFHQSMKPFYILLDWLEKFRLGKKNDVLDNPTHTTEFRKLNEAVSRFASHSEEMFEQQKQFIGNASHEIQTPLAICQNRLEMLMEDETLSEQQMGEIAKTCQTLEYVSKLNKSLLLLSKIDNSQFASVEKVCLNEILYRYLDDYQEVYDYKGITLDVHEKNTFNITMNGTLAVVLITNLLKNAFVHNIYKGKIQIEITSSNIRFGNTGKDEHLDEKHIFERFYQGSKKEGSTGLGLAIVDAICRQSQLSIQYQFVKGWHWFDISC
ncbi:MAG: HAMP domain-containing histidine kinase [Bacteroidaceae bacterium]|nr:HAMP domain-containing histidine kinase [Bacteroidaceae bacterium]